MSIIRNVLFQKKTFGTIFCQLCSKKNLPIFLQEITITKLNGLHIRLCSTASVKATLDSKCCNASDNLKRTNYLENLHYALDENFTLEDLEKSDLLTISERFKLKGLSIQCIQKYNMRVSPDLTELFFPFDYLNKEFSAIQTLVYNEQSVEKNISTQFSSGSKEPALFGWSLVEPDERILVVTSDPLDAIAVNQMTDIASVALPHTFTMFSPELLDAFEGFNKVVFWMRPNLHNWEFHIVLGKALKENGYFIWSHEFSNPMLCLQNGANIKQILRGAYPLFNDSVVGSFDTYKNVIYDESKNKEKTEGLKWKRFAPLNEVLKGHRRGELTIFTGQTGMGKTTFMSDYSLDLCTQGMPTLWASFEIPYARLLKTMLCQYAMLPMDEILPEYESWASKFKTIPMFVLHFQNCHSLEGILRGMLTTVRLYNIQHIVVDNLQFMMNMEDYNSNIDQLRRQDQVFSAFREFATMWNVHITLVIHPRKEPEFCELNITSISGTAKSTQEADNVLILQTTLTKQYIQITKNRFDGQKGGILVEFDKETFRYTMKKVDANAKHSDKKLTVL